MKHYLCCQLLMIALSQASQAAVILDQEFKLPPHTGTNYYIDYAGDYLAQTFTVRNSGELAGVGVQASLSRPYLGEPIDALHIRVTRIDGQGYPLTDQVLAEGTISPTDLPIEALVSPETITDVDLSSWRVPVTAGDRLALLFSSDNTSFDDGLGPGYVWFFQSGNLHPGGEYMIYSPQLYGPKPLRDIWLGGGDKRVDAGFRVYVKTIPEPQSLVLFALGCVACLRFKRRRFDR